MGFSYNPQLPILSWPHDIQPNSRTLTLVTNTSRLTSPLSRTTQTQELPGARWTLRASFPSLDERQVKTLRAFIAKLKGSSGLFYFKATSDDTELVPQPTLEYGAIVMGPDVVKFGHRTRETFQGEELLSMGWEEAEGELVLEAGDYVSYDDFTGFRRLHVVTQDVYCEADGEATIPVEPPVRVQLPTNARLHIDRASGVFRLLDDEQCSVTVSADGTAMVTLEALEAVSPQVFVAGAEPPDFPFVPGEIPADLGWHASVNNPDGIAKPYNAGVGRHGYDYLTYYASALYAPALATFAWELTWSPDTAGAPGPYIAHDLGATVGLAFQPGPVSSGRAYLRLRINGEYPVPETLILTIGSGDTPRVQWSRDAIVGI